MLKLPLRSENITSFLSITCFLEFLPWYSGLRTDCSSSDHCRGAGSILSLTHRVKGYSIPAVWIQTLAQELPYGTGVAMKERKREKKEKKEKKERNEERKEKENLLLISLGYQRVTQVIWKEHVKCCLQKPDFTSFSSVRAELSTVDGRRGALSLAVHLSISFQAPLRKDSEPFLLCISDIIHSFEPDIVLDTGDRIYIKSLYPLKLIFLKHMIDPQLFN